MQFSITAQSAWSTLQILDRQARKDTAKVIRFTTWLVNALTSRQAVQTYRAIGRLMVIAWMIAVYVYLLIEQQANRVVDSCLEQSEIVDVVPDVLIDGDELAAELSRIAAEVNAEPTPIAKLDLSDLSIRQLKAIAREVKLPRYNNNPKDVLANRLSALCPMEVERALQAIA